MLRKVKIKSYPKKAEGGKVRVNPGMGFNATTLNWPAMPGQMSNKPTSANETVGPVPRENANVEAEKGETVLTDFVKAGIPQHYKIGGKRHSQGGTPLNLSPDSFIFSDTKAMKISDEDVLAMFNKTKKKGGGVTPADIAKQYDINTYYKTLMDPNSDDLQRKTAEMMIANYNLKLGKLGLIQESMKGFPQGLPAISQPYIESLGLDPTKFVQTQGQPEQPAGDMAKYGKEIKKGLPRADNGWIKQILDFESKQGSAQGTGLDNYGIKKDVWQKKYPEMWEDNKITEDEAVDFITREYLPLVKDYPEEAQKRLVDYAYNTGRDIRDVVMLASGVQNLDNIQTKKTDEALWNANQDKITKAMNDPAFINKIDDAKKQIYGDFWQRKGNPDAYQKTSLPRVDMWNQSTPSKGTASAVNAVPESASNNATSTNDQNSFDANAARGQRTLDKIVEGKGQPQIGQTYDDWWTSDGSTPGFAPNNTVWDGKDWVKPEDTDIKPNQGVGFPGRIFGNRRQPTGFRINNRTGLIEALNNRGEVVGYANPGQISGAANMGMPGGFNVGGGSSTTTTTTSTKKVKKQNIPSDAIILKKSDPDYIKKRDEAYAQNPGKVYIQDDSGKYFKVKESGYTPDDQLGLIEERFKNPAVAKALKEQAIANLKDPVKSKKISGRDLRFKIDELEKMSDEEFASKFIDMQKRNIGLIKNNIDVKNYDQDGKLIAGKKGPATLQKAFEQINMPVSDKEAALEQAAYISYADLVNAKDAGNIQDENLATALKPFKVKQVGAGDEKYNFDVGDDISRIDGYYTNTSAGQVAGIEGKKLGEEGVQETEEDETTTQTQGEAQQDFAMYPPRMPKKEIFAQDAIKTLGAWGDLMRVKKYMPWQATPDLEQRQGVYYSPERELAANAEQSNIAQNVLAMFAGPKLYSSRASQIQGQGAKNAADILGRYNNLNVGVANQVEQENFAARNRYNELKAKLATDLYDKNTIANQQFDNAKNLGRQNLRQSFIDTITNASMAYNLNQLYPQFNISPSRGGDIFFTEGKKIKPSATTQNDLASQFNAMKSKLPASVSDDVIWKMVKEGSGSKTSSDFDPEGLAALQGLMSNLG